MINKTSFVTISSLPIDFKKNKYNNTRFYNEEFLRALLKISVLTLTSIYFRNKFPNHNVALQSKGKSLRNYDFSRLKIMRIVL